MMIWKWLDRLRPRRKLKPGPGLKKNEMIPGIEALVQQNLVPGLALAIEREGKILRHEGYGFADLEQRIPVNPASTLFRAASISKPITSLVVMRMIDMGALDLDTPIKEYHSALPVDKGALTLRQLLSHTAGIRSYRGKEFAMNKDLCIQESLEVFIEDPLLFEPGSEYLYNSFDFVLVSAILEKVSGKEFEHLCRELVFRPLGMEATRPEDPGEENTDLAKFYTRSKQGFRNAVRVDNRYKLAGGGFVLPVSDLLRLGQAVLDRALVPDKLWDEFLTPLEVEGDSTFYGLGWEVSKDSEGRPFIGHTGNSVGAHSLFRVYPQRGTVAAILVNCTNPGIEEQLEQMLLQF